LNTLSGSSRSESATAGLPRYGSFRRLANAKKPLAARSFFGRLARFALVALLVLVVCLPGCKEDYPDPQLQVEGGLVQSMTRDSVIVKAISPTVRMDLQRDSSDRRAFTITVLNVRADDVSVRVPGSDPPGAEPKLEVKKLSSVSTELLVKRGAGSIILETKPDQPDLMRFAVIGDTQGRNYIFSSMVPLINDSGADFLVHLGDMTPSGAAAEFQAFDAALQALEVPCYAVPGNHDVRDSDSTLFEERFGPPNRYFDLAGWRLVFLDTSAIGLSPDGLSWLKEALVGTGAPKLVFMHVPPLDPRGEDHCFLDESQATALMDVLTDPVHSVKAVFTGHVHMFSQGVAGDVTFVTSGGGGAGLYASPQDGGFHHFAVVEATPGGVTVTPVQKPAGEVSNDLVLKGKTGEVLLSLEELSGLDTREAKAKYQNRYENFSAEALYRGVPVGALVQLVGGMEESDTLVVHASDGYTQEFSYKNVFPDSSWLEIQGEMIVAISMDGKTPPEWDDGYRIAFLPPDGVYSNADCAETSVEGQGWGIYESAGARWVKNVVRLEVRPWEE
jgi:predicted phosphodiesterase